MPSSKKAGRARLLPTPSDPTEEYVLLQQLRELKAGDTGKPKGEPPTALGVRQITVMPELFQPRAINEKHISDLARVIANKGFVDPVVVLQVGGRRVLIDGHHRVEAYKVAKLTKAIPVRFFDGSVDDALLESGRANSKLKLPMSNLERQNRGWTLVLLGQHSKAEIAASSGISEAQVSVMRRTKAQLGSQAFEAQYWWQARNMANGIERGLDEAEQDQWKSDLADEFADRLAKEFSTKLARHPEVAAQALATYFGRALPRVWDELRGYIAEEDQAEDHDDF